MWPEGAKEDMVRLFRDLGSGKDREEVLRKLTNHLNELAKAHVMYPMPDDIGPVACRALADPIRNEVNADHLGAMASLAQSFGRGPRTAKLTEPESQLAKALITRMNDRSLRPHFMENQGVGWAIMAAIDRLGTPAKSQALKDLNIPENSFVRDSIEGFLETRVNDVAW